MAVVSPSSQSPITESPVVDDTTTFETTTLATSTTTSSTKDDAKPLTNDDEEGVSTPITTVTTSTTTSTSQVKKDHNVCCMCVHIELTNCVHLTFNICYDHLHAYLTYLQSGGSREIPSVQCNGPNVNTNCPTDRISYSCEEDKFLCCKWTNLPSDEYEILVQLSEIDLPMFGICFVDENDTTTTEEREGVKQMGGGPNKLEVNPLSISEYMSSAMALGISSLIATTLVTTFTAFLL